MQRVCLLIFILFFSFIEKSFSQNSQSTSVSSFSETKTNSEFTTTRTTSLQMHTNSLNTFGFSYFGERNCPETAADFERLRQTIPYYSCNCKNGFRSNAYSPDKIYCEEYDTSRQVHTDVRAQSLPQSLSNCLSAVRQQILQCQNSSGQAVAECNQGREKLTEKKNWTDVIKAGEIVTSKRYAEKGAAERCAEVTQSSQLAFYSLDSSTSNCSPQVESCKSICAQAKSASEQSTLLMNQCRSLYNSLFNRREASLGFTEEEFRHLQSETTDNGFSISFQSQLQNQINQLANQVQGPYSVCYNDAVASKENNDKALKEIDETSKQANYCQCLLNSNQQNCEQAKQVSPLTCKQNPKQEGCQALLSKACVNSSTPECLCAKDPNSAACILLSKKEDSQIAQGAVVANKGSASGLAGADAQTVNRGGANTNLLNSGGSLTQAQPSNLKINTNSEIESTTENINALKGRTASSIDPTDGGFATRSNYIRPGTEFKSLDIRDEGSDTQKNSKNKKTSFFEEAKNTLTRFAEGSFFESSQKFSDPKAKLEQEEKINSARWKPAYKLRGIASDREFHSRESNLFVVIKAQYKKQSDKNWFYFDR